MKKQTIAMLRDLILTGKLTEDEIAGLENDSRKGVQKLLRSYRQMQKQQKHLKEKYEKMLYFERELYQGGCEYIAGIDEAGRGPLAGPVVAAAVILPRDSHLEGLNDSKLLTEAQRNMFFEKIKEVAICYSIAIIDSDVIDDINIYEATKSAMRQAIHTLDVSPDHVLVDAVELDGLTHPTSAIIKGDSRSISIAAASVLAKVTRDGIMAELHAETPEYDFLSNKGYGTKHHLQTLREKGATIHHRKTFAPVRDCLL